MDVAVNKRVAQTHDMLEGCIPCLHGDFDVVSDTLGVCYIGSSLGFCGDGYTLLMIVGSEKRLPCHF